MTTIDPRFDDARPSSPHASALPEVPPVRAGLREWCALAVLMIPVLLVSVDNTVLSFALPSISTELRPTGSQLLWIVDVYALMLAGLLIAMGSIGDRVGRRRLLVIGSIGFGAASLVAAYASSAEMLLTARALLGFFGATLMPSTLSLLRNVFHHAHDRRLAIAAWAAMFSGGAALGPVLGGYLLEHFWWGSVFLINVPLIVLLVPLALWLVPESKDPNPGPLDPTSILLAVVAMLPVVYGIKHLAKAGLDDVTLASFGLGVAAGVLFVRRQRRSVSPMLDLTLFRNPVFSGALAANLLSLMGLTGFLFFAAQLLQLVLGLSPMMSAMVLLPGLLVTELRRVVARLRRGGVHGAPDGRERPRRLRGDGRGHRTGRDPDERPRARGRPAAQGRVGVGDLRDRLRDRRRARHGGAGQHPHGHLPGRADRAGHAAAR